MLQTEMKSSPLSPAKRKWQESHSSNDIFIQGPQAVHEVPLVELEFIRSLVLVFIFINGVSFAQLHSFAFVVCLIEGPAFRRWLTAYILAFLGVIAGTSSLPFHLAGQKHQSLLLDGISGIS